MTDNVSSARPLLFTVYFIYFFCGLTLCFEGAFNPELKDYFQLGYQQQMYTMLAKNIPFVLAVAIGFLIPRFGYQKCLSVGMTLFAVGTLALVPGLHYHSYALVLGAFFIIGLGFNVQLVAGNPLLCALGPPDGISSRLNVGNALGAIAQILGPVSLSLIIPAGVTTVQGKVPYMKALFAAIGFLLVGLSLLTCLVRQRGSVLATNRPRTETQSALSPGPSWLRPKVVCGFAVIFLVLGAEAGLFGFYRNYLEDPGIAGMSSHESQRMFTLYFAVFALGRMVGAAVQKRIRPVWTLLAGAAAALALAGMIVSTKGTLAIVAVTAIGFFISIFFPTLYAVAIEGLGEQTAKASGLLTTGFLGCAVLPVMQGRIADRFGLQPSYALAFVVYLIVLAYALKALQSITPGNSTRSS